MEENKEVVNVEEGQNEVDQEVVEQVEAKWAFAKKWLVLCGVLFLILIVLGIVLYFVKTGEDLWNKPEPALNNLINLLR